MKKSKINDKCRNKSREVFIRNYGRSNFHILGPFSDTKPVTESGERINFIYQKLKMKTLNYPYFPDKNHILVRNVELIKDILEIYDDLIQGFTIHFYMMNMIESKTVIETINNNPINLLKRLMLSKCHGDVLSELNPILEIESLAFSSSDSKPFHFDKNLEKLFPNLKCLYILDTRSSDWSFITAEFPKLRIFEVSFPIIENEYKNIESHVIDFLKINSNVSCVLLNNVTLNFLNEINGILTNLTILDINSLSNNYQNYQGVIDFGNIDELVIKSNKPPENISFYKLNKLNLHINHHITNKWIEFFKYNVKKDLKTFKLKTEHLQKDQFLKIGETFINSDRVIIDCLTQFIADDIVNFTQLATNIYTLELTAFIDDSEQKLLEDKISGDWIVKFTPVDGQRIEIYIRK